jgi:23S rRNA G2069 N7-methylase RlmK/C1962 C5-methylase RlmI
MASMLENRLRKNLARVGPWAKREGIEAYRVYDRDIPERPWLIDRYGEHVLVSEYVTPVGRRLTDSQRNEEREEVLAAVSAVLNVSGDRVHWKTRERHKSLEREAQGSPAHELPVLERGHTFLVNLDDYLDTGLFLDHRAARKRIGAQAAGKRFLNLFCYTGSFTVYAAKGGAKSTTSVDLSSTYLGWAERNLKANQLPLATNALVRSDVFEYLRSSSETFDLIVLDPPTLSKSKQARAFDVQRDHVELINLTLARLAPDGLLLFSTNYRQFELHASKLQTSKVLEVTTETKAGDFRESLHRAWELRR